MCIPLIASSPLNNDRGYVLRFFLHLLRLSCAILNEPVEIAADDEDLWMDNLDESARLGSILVQMLLWVSRCIMYVPDSEPSATPGSTEQVSTDVVSFLLTFPRPGLAGADCEDFAALSITLFTQLRNIHTWWPERPRRTKKWPWADVPTYDPALPLLHSISELANEYTPWYLATQIWVERVETTDVFSGHAVCALLDRRAVCERMLGHGRREGQMQDPELYHPALLVDGVGHSSGVWSKEWRKRERSDKRLGSQLAYVENDVLKAQPDPRRARRILKEFVPASEMCKDKMYGPVAQMLTAQYDPPADSSALESDWRGLHVVPFGLQRGEGGAHIRNEQAEDAMGITMKDLLTYNFTPRRMYVNQTFADHHLDYLRACMADMPVSTLPPNVPDMEQSQRVSRQLQQLHTTKDMSWKSGILTARAIDVEIAHSNDDADDPDRYLRQIIKDSVKVVLCDEMACVEILV